MKAASSPGGFALNLLIWLAALLWSLPMQVAPACQSRVVTVLS